jgi:predicted phage terminase large subunit-like protein
VIQQRMHMEDVVGTALGSDVPWVHCNIPMEYEPRAYVNGWRTGSAMIESFFDDEVDECSELFWADWRTEEGELAWPARFPETTLVQMKASMGPTAIAAQLQQHPIPRGGAIIKRDWWQVWPTNDPFPPLSYIVAALDTAYTADTSNDPSAMTIWGVNRDEYDNPRLFLLWAWQEWLELHDLVEKIIDICQIDKRPVQGPRFPVDRLLIEDATVGKSVNQELDRILRQRMTFGIDLCNPRNYGGDKTARMYSIEHVFSQKMVYAHERSWSEKVIDQCASVPYTSDDHLADTVAMAIRWLRDCGYAPKREEVAEEYLTLRTFKPRLRPLYPGNSAR